MWTVHDVASEIESIAVLLQSRRSTASSQNEERERSLVANCCRKIESMMNISAADASTLFDAVGKTSLPEPLKQMICEAIDTALANVNVENQDSPTTKPQTLVHINKYLTKQDWADLENDLSLVGKANVLARRLRSLGVKSCSEMTIRYSVALLLALLPQNAFPKYDIVYDLVQDFKQVFLSCKCPSTAPWVKVFPEKPDLLPRQHFEAAYGCQMVEPREVERLTTIAVYHMPMRSTSKLLTQKPGKRAAKAVHETENNGGKSAADVWASLAQMQQVQNNMMLVLAGGIQKGPKITLSPPKDKGGNPMAPRAVPLPDAEKIAGAGGLSAMKALTLPIGAGDIAPVAAFEKKRKFSLGPVPDEADNNGEGDNDEPNAKGMTSAGFEQAAFEALKGRKQKPPAKKPAASASKAPKKRLHQRRNHLQMEMIAHHRLHTKLKSTRTHWASGGSLEI